MEISDDMLTIKAFKTYKPPSIAFEAYAGEEEEEGELSFGFEEDFTLFQDIKKTPPPQFLKKHGRYFYQQCF